MASSHLGNCTPKERENSLPALGVGSTLPRLCINDIRQSRDSIPQKQIDYSVPKIAVGPGCKYYTLTKACDLRVKRGSFACHVWLALVHCASHKLHVKEPYVTHVSVSSQMLQPLSWVLDVWKAIACGSSTLENEYMQVRKFASPPRALVFTGTTFSVSCRMHIYAQHSVPLCTTLRNPKCCICTMFISKELQGVKNLDWLQNLSKPGDFP